MVKIFERYGETLRWVQPKALERYFELGAADETIATLTFRSSFGTLATARTAAGNWTFKRVGFLNPRVTIRESGSEEDLALYQPKFWGGGVLTFKKRRAFNWQPTNFWHTDWAFVDTQDAQVVTFKSGIKNEKLRDIFKSQFSVVLHQSEEIRHEAAILVTLGLYLLILQQDDTAAVVAAT